MGPDSYPILVTSTVGSWSDLERIFSEVLMAGRFRSDLYRPLLSASFALDYAVWGLDPFGFHLTTLLIFGACACALYQLVTRLLPEPSWRAALIAALVFMLYPAHYEVLPVPARRADPLCALFALLALSSHLSPHAQSRTGPAWLAGIFALLAMGAKETGLLVPPLAAVLVFLYSARAFPFGRLRQALVVTAPAWAALAVSLLARARVIGGLGGHETAGLQNLVDALTLLRGTVFPHDVMFGTPWAWVLLGAFGVALAATIAARPRGTPGFPPSAWRALAFASVWLVTMLALHAYSGKMHRWYLFFPAIGWAIAAGVVLDALLGVALGSPPRARIAAASAAALLAGMLTWQMRYAPLVYPYPEWARGSDALSRYLEAAKHAIRAAPDGTVLSLGPLPSYWWASTQEKRSRGVVHTVSAMRTDSFRAWTELAFPERRIDIRRGRAQARSSAPPDRLVIVIPEEGS